MRKKSSKTRKKSPKKCRKSSPKKKNTQNKFSQLVPLHKRLFYPFWYTKLAFPNVPNNKLTNAITWKKHLKLASNIFKNKILPAKTLLFHGSPLIDPIKVLHTSLVKSNKPFFFGLDAFIAIWYITEYSYKHTSKVEWIFNHIISGIKEEQKTIKTMKSHNYSEKVLKVNYEKLHKLEKQKEELTRILHNLDSDKESLESYANNLQMHSRQYYFLNIYETQKPLSYIYLDSTKYPLDNIIENINPLDEEQCHNKACMHPQFGYHQIVGYSQPAELSMELTIPGNKLKKNLKLVKVKLIDISILLKNLDKNFRQFKAINALVL